MSSISGVNGSGLDINQLIRRLTSQQTSDTEAARRPRPADGKPPADFESKFGEALKAAGVSDDEVAAIQDEITTAISEATQNQDGTGDSRDAIKSAIDETLKKHGLDAAKIQEQFRSIAGPPPGGPPPGAGGPGGHGGHGGSSTAASTSDSTQDSQTTQELLQQLLSSGTLDSQTAQLLQSLMPSLDATA